jgi:hypothetical protein
MHFWNKLTLTKLVQLALYVLKCVPLFHPAATPNYEHKSPDNRNHSS